VMRMPGLMVREDGEWKFDMATTQQRMMTGLDAALGQMAGALGQAMEGVGEAMATGLREAFGEGSAEPLPAAAPAQSWDHAEMTPQPDEFYPLPELTTMPKTQAALSEAIGSPVLVQAALADLLRGFGEEQHDALVNWFEDQLFAGWAAMLAEAAKQFPLRDRLRALRIEGVHRAEARMLLVDGSDLVYRMVLPNNDGFYQDHEVAALLPGVLAQLPEAIDAAAAGRRLLPGEEDSPDCALQRDRLAPRFMRRIGALVGHPVALEADWDELCTSTIAGRVLALWGFNRILGGLALARLDPELNAALAAGLKCIRIVMNFDITRRYARYEDGALEVGLSYHEGGQTGPAESEVAAALAGSPVE